MGWKENRSIKELERRVILSNFFEKVRIKESCFSLDEKNNARYIREFLGEVAKDMESIFLFHKFTEGGIAEKAYIAFGGGEDIKKSKIKKYAGKLRKMQSHIESLVENPELFYNNGHYKELINNLTIICYGCI